MDWVWAGVAIVAGFVLGGAASKVTKGLFEKRRGQIAQLAPAAASLVFSLILVVGLLVSLGFVQPDSLSKLRDDTIDYPYYVVRPQLFIDALDVTQSDVDWCRILTGDQYWRKV